MASPRLLLLELLSSDRFAQNRSDAFAFVQARARALGVPVRWAAFGYHPHELREPFVVDLSAPDRDALRALLEDFAPTHVLVNERLAAPVDALVRAQAGRTELSEGNWDWAIASILQDFLGVAPDDLPPRTFLPGVLEPDFASVAGNELARTIRPFVPVLAGPACLWRRPLARHPLYAQLDLSGCSTHGCSFCHPDWNPRHALGVPAHEAALRQVRAAWRTCPPERRSGEFVITGGVLLFRLQAFVDGLLESGVPASAFYFSNRIDEVLRLADDIEAALPRLAAAGHSLRFFTPGVENFSAEENERFAKGIDAAQVKAFHAKTSDWERRFPGTFEFSKHGGYSFITFTPWTRLSDLETNLAALRELGLRPGRSFATARLQLLPDRAIARLAQKDGLVVPRFDDAVAGGTAVSACVRSADVREIPWRFRHPDTALVYSVLVRALPSTAREPPRDAADEALDRAIEEMPLSVRNEDRLLPALVAALRADPSVADAVALARRVSDLEAQARAPEPPVPVVPEPRRAAEREACSLAARLGKLAEHLAASPRRPLKGFSPVSASGRAEADGSFRLAITLARGAEQLVLDLRPAPAPAWLSTARLAATYRREAPVDTPDKDRAARALVAAFEQVLPPREHG